MARTGLIYESNTSEQAATVKKLMFILGAGRYFKTSEFVPELRDTYDFYFIGGPASDGTPDARITNFVSNNLGWLKNKRVALFALGTLGTASDSGFTTLTSMLGDAVLGHEVVNTGNVAAIAETGLRVKALRDAGDVKLPAPELKQHIEKFLGGHKYCTLCTGYGNRVRGTAVTYKYHEGHMYIVCEGAAKFANLILNDNVCIAMHAPFQGVGTAGLQLTGKVKILDPASDSYRRMMEIKGSDYQRLTHLPWILWGLDVKLAKAEFWWAEWRNQGIGPKQTYIFEEARK
ncbi:MAG: pyridoxamine 5'-phosphate oxidase family protein [Chloroflexota bacterium]